MRVVVTFTPVGSSFRAAFVYDLSSGFVGVEVEGFGEGGGGGVVVGEDAAGFGTSASGGVEQHGFLDACQGAQEFAAAGNGRYMVSDTTPTGSPSAASSSARSGTRSP